MARRPAAREWPASRDCAARECARRPDLPACSRESEQRCGGWARPTPQHRAARPVPSPDRSKPAGCRRRARRWWPSRSWTQHRDGKPRPGEGWAGPRAAASRAAEASATSRAWSPRPRKTNCGLTVSLAPVDHRTARSWSARNVGNSIALLSDQRRTMLVEATGYGNGPATGCALGRWCPKRHPPTARGRWARGVGAASDHSVRNGTRLAREPHGPGKRVRYRTAVSATAPAWRKELTDRGRRNPRCGRAISLVRGMCNRAVARHNGVCDATDAQSVPAPPALDVRRNGPWLPPAGARSFPRCHPPVLRVLRSTMRGWGR